MHYRETSATILILTPVQFAKQWQEELCEKYGIEFVCNFEGGFDA